MLPTKRGHIADGHPTWGQPRARHHGGHGVENVLARLLKDGLRDRKRQCARDVLAEPARREANLFKPFDHAAAPYRNRRQESVRIVGGAYNALGWRKLPISVTITCP